jgi:hypothetical protein
MARITFDDLLRMKSAIIPGTWAAEAMGMSPTRLIGYARERPELIQFPYQVSGNRMKVPRVPFLRWAGYSDEEIKSTASVAALTVERTGPL